LVLTLSLGGEPFGPVAEVGHAFRAADPPLFVEAATDLL